MSIGQPNNLTGSMTLPEDDLKGRIPKLEFVQKSFEQPDSMQVLETRVYKDS